MNEVIKIEIDRLVSDLACCDRDGCRCWQATDYLRQIAEYARKEFESSPVTKFARESVLPVMKPVPTGAAGNTDIELVKTP